MISKTREEEKQEINMAEQIPRETQARITMKTRPDCDKPDDRLMTGFTA